MVEKEHNKSVLPRERLTAQGAGKVNQENDPIQIPKTGEVPKEVNFSENQKARMPGEKRSPDEFNFDPGRKPLAPGEKSVPDEIKFKREEIKLKRVDVLKFRDKIGKDGVLSFRTEKDHLNAIEANNRVKDEIVSKLQELRGICVDYESELRKNGKKSGFFTLEIIKIDKTIAKYQDRSENREVNIQKAEKGLNEALGYYEEVMEFKRQKGVDRKEEVIVESQSSDKENEVDLKKKLGQLFDKKDQGGAKSDARKPDELPDSDSSQSTLGENGTGFFELSDEAAVAAEKKLAEEQEARRNEAKSKIQEKQIESKSLKNELQQLNAQILEYEKGSWKSWLNPKKFFRLPKMRDEHDEKQEQLNKLEKDIEQLKKQLAEVEGE